MAKASVWKKNIRTALPTLSPALRRIGEFILDNPDETALAPLRVLASRVGSPPSAFTRFSQAVGYSGFRPLQLALKSDVFTRSEGVHAQLNRRRSSLAHAALATEITDMVAGRAMEVEALAETLHGNSLMVAANIVASSDGVVLAHDEPGRVPAALLARLLGDLGFIVGVRAEGESLPPPRIPVVAFLVAPPGHTEAPIERRLKASERAILVTCRGREDIGLPAVLTLPTPVVPRSHPIVSAVVVAEILATRVAQLRRPRMQPEIDFDPVGW